MNLEKLYKMQSELDNYIIKNRNITISEAELLDKTILALLVEVGELANATRCFKHWSTKGPESKERLLEELADIWHFYLSIGNQTGKRFETITIISMEKVVEVIQKNESCFNLNRNELIVKTLLEIYGNITENKYESTGKAIRVIGWLLDFTDEEVEQAYVKKHEENYRRQAEGY
ncbi:hypothetical protein CIW83_18280 [Tissierella sp. P1]|uniref:dUTP diphosphatase n=1 Tax=Tissierella sp. P1 TaxID=1280483 RepID=UPI000B9FCDF3|nr:dUTP diphosphatase [Tissierella sp. P1]OZV10767.1 hypothetical protein CIW83_18280 [Tissierella sp. P1]